MEDKVISIRIDKELKERIVKASLRNRRSIANWVKIAILNELDVEDEAVRKLEFEKYQEKQNDK